MLTLGQVGLEQRARIIEAAALVTDLDAEVAAGINADDAIVKGHNAQGAKVAAFIRQARQHPARQPRIDGLHRHAY